MTPIIREFFAAAKWRTLEKQSLAGQCGLTIFFATMNNNAEPAGDIYAAETSVVRLHLALSRASCDRRTQETELAG